LRENHRRRIREIKPDRLLDPAAMKPQANTLDTRSTERLPVSKIPAALLFLLLCAVSLLVAAQPHTREHPIAITGTVIKVRDGDTLQMLTDTGRRIEVRLNAIDAPEKAHGGMRSQPHAERSRLNLAQIALRRRATLVHTTMDKYGRHVGMLALDTAQGEVDAGWWQVQSGNAWTYERYLNELPVRMRLRYREAQSQAKAAQRGLWAEARPIPPWDWRKRQSAP